MTVVTTAMKITTITKIKVEAKEKKYAEGFLKKTIKR